jgi:hypothetical protein
MQTRFISLDERPVVGFLCPIEPETSIAQRGQTLVQAPLPNGNILCTSITSLTVASPGFILHTAYDASYLRLDAMFTQYTSHYELIA